MDDTEKYLIHATVTTDGVVERSDVVGAIFGQTEGLLGDELDLPELRRTEKIGRIDVSVSSADGDARGEITIASRLDKVETATLAAALETIDRVGPCRATVTVDEIEDVRAAKRRAVVDRATELLRTGFDDSVMSSAEILSNVREQVRVADITEYEGFPAGPRVAESDAIIVVEGRSDVLTLLSYGIKNAIAVEGTDVPAEIAGLTADRTVTAFLDGDRGGDLILEELLQTGEVDYVARPPAGSSVEDLDHHDVFTALRDKDPVGPEFTSSVSARDDDDGAGIETPPAEETEQPTRPASSTDGGSTTAERGDRAYATNSRPQAGPNDAHGADPTTGQSNSSPASSASADVPPETATGRADSDGEGLAAPAEGGEPADAGSTADGTESPTAGEAPSASEEGTPEPERSSPLSLYEHVSAVVDEGTGAVRFLDDDRSVIGEFPADEAGSALDTVERAPTTMVLDGILSQAVLDRAAEAGVAEIVAESTGQFVKRPASVRVHEAADVADAPPDGG